MPGELSEFILSVIRMKDQMTAAFGCYSLSRAVCTA